MQFIYTYVSEARVAGTGYACCSTISKYHYREMTRGQSKQDAEICSHNYNSVSSWSFFALLEHVYECSLTDLTVTFNLLMSRLMLSPRLTRSHKSSVLRLNEYYQS